MKLVSGVYRIRNKVNGRVYIGSSVNIEKRLYEHLNSLKKRRPHHSIFLQRSFDKYGEDAFEFTPVEYVADKEKLTEREQIWMDFYQVVKYGFNIRIKADSQLGTKRTVEQNRKNSERGKVYKQTSEQRRKNSESKKGYKWSAESIEKIKETKRKKPWKPTTERNRNVSAALTGTKQSPDHTRKIKASVQATWSRKRFFNYFINFNGGESCSDLSTSQHSSR